MCLTRSPLLNPRGTSALLPSAAACASRQKNAKSKGRQADATAPEHSLAYVLKVSLIYQIPHLFHNLLHGCKVCIANLHVLNMLDTSRMGKWFTLVRYTGLPVRQALIACHRVACTAEDCVYAIKIALPQLCPHPKRSRCLTSLSLLSPTHRCFRPLTKFNKS